MTNRATSATSGPNRGRPAGGGELGDWAVGRRPALPAAGPGPAARPSSAGTLPPGARLPAERALAAAVSVSRGTAVAAYDLLVADGLVERIGTAAAPS